MFKEDLEKVIEEIQFKNKDLKSFPSLLETCNPGESGFKPKSVGSTGYLLLSPFRISTKPSIIQGKKNDLSDFMGISPRMMVVMESGSTFYKTGDIVIMDKYIYNDIEEYLFIVKASMAYFIPESLVLGIEQEITDLVKERFNSNKDA